MKENRFVSPPGALKKSDKKVRVTEEDMKEGEARFQRLSKKLDVTPIDENTLEVIRARKKKESHSSSIAQS